MHFNDMTPATNMFKFLNVADDIYRFLFSILKVFKLSHNLKPKHNAINMKKDWWHGLEGDGTFLANLTA